MNQFTVRRAFRCPLAPEWGRGGTLALAAAHRAQIGAQAGVISNVPAGAVVLGSPAQPRTEFFRQVATLKRLIQKPK